jgi:4-diphosphocytidyl-2-C-methyl-D-erythritol kinase
MPSLTLLAPAKINLGLRVLRKRADGYHDIESVFVAINLCDELVISPADVLTVTCEPEMTLDPEDNLVFRAAQMLQKAAGTSELTANIRLTKRIPAGAGLGGGSSDAAAALEGLNTFWHLGLSTRELLPIAASVGSDVPFFLYGGAAIVEGRGEIIHPLDIHIPWIILVVTTDVHISTANAYARIDRYPQQDLFSNPLSDLLAQLLEETSHNHGKLDDYWWHQFRNEFSSVMAPDHPYLATTSQLLVDNGAFFSSLTGSGSAMYGLFTDVDKATAAASALAPSHTTYICRPIRRGHWE